MKKLISILVVFFSIHSMADYEGYDEIVDKLSNYKNSELRKKQAYRSEVRTFSKAHIGLGLTQTFFDADAVGFNSRMQNQGGLIINVGVDVFNTNWGVEGSYANFGTSNVSDSQIKLREFNLKGLYKPSIDKTWSMRLGLGFSSRFLNINNSSANSEFKTPSGLFLFGVESYINSFISVGADMNFKTAMISDTIDKNSVDVAFRIDTHF